MSPEGVRVRQIGYGRSSEARLSLNCVAGRTASLSTLMERPRGATHSYSSQFGLGRCWVRTPCRSQRAVDQDMEVGMKMGAIKSTKEHGMNLAMEQAANAGGAAARM